MIVVRYDVLDYEEDEIEGLLWLYMCDFGS